MEKRKLYRHRACRKRLSVVRDNEPAKTLEGGESSAKCVRELNSSHFDKKCPPCTVSLCVKITDAASIFVLLYSVFESFQLCYIFLVL